MDQGHWSTSNLQDRYIYIYIYTCVYVKFFKFLYKDFFLVVLGEILMQHGNLYFATTWLSLKRSSPFDENCSFFFYKNIFFKCLNFFLGQVSLYMGFGRSISVNPDMGHLIIFWGCMQYFGGAYLETKLMASFMWIAIKFWIYKN